MTTRTLAAIAAVSLSVLTHSAHASPSTDPFVKIFLSACVVSHAQPAAVSEEAQRLGLKEIEDEVADRYLVELPGRAWRGDVDGNTYAVAVRFDGSCSVFVQEGNVEQLQEAIESWLPPAGSGISIARDQPSAPQGLQSFRYVMQGRRVHEEWLLTVSHVDLPLPLRAIVTYRGL
ncbi:NMCC_0638 family (lipo)protein [Lysobacter sp. A289]